MQLTDIVTYHILLLDTLLTLPGCDKKDSPQSRRRRRRTKVQNLSHKDQGKSNKLELSFAFHCVVRQAAVDQGHKFTGLEAELAVSVDIKGAFADSAKAFTGRLHCLKDRERPLHQDKGRPYAGQRSGKARSITPMQESVEEAVTLRVLWAVTNQSIVSAFGREMHLVGSDWC